MESSPVVSVLYIHDILQHIAYFTSLDSTIQPPVDLLHLLLTCKTIYRSLAVKSCPHLYAKIFRTRFDTEVENGYPDSRLAGELVQRYRLLQRVRRGDTLVLRLQSDLWAALRMVISDYGLNGRHLTEAGFPRFIMSTLQSYLKERAPPRSDSCIALILWLIALTWTRGMLSLLAAIRC
jgi:hypothetical protein